MTSGGRYECISNEYVVFMSGKLFIFSKHRAIFTAILLCFTDPPKCFTRFYFALQRVALFSEDIFMFHSVSHTGVNEERRDKFGNFFNKIKKRFDGKNRYR